MFEYPYRLLSEKAVWKEVKHPKGLLPLGRSTLKVSLVVGTQAPKGLANDGLVLPEHFFGDFHYIVGVSVVDASSVNFRHFIGVILVAVLAVGEDGISFLEMLTLPPRLYPLDVQLVQAQEFFDINHTFKLRILVKPVLNAELVIPLEENHLALRTNQLAVSLKELTTLLEVGLQPQLLLAGLSNHPPGDFVEVKEVS